MKPIANVLCIFALFTSSVMAADNGGNNVTDAQRAKVREQVQSLQTQKIQDAQTINSNIRKDALRQGQAIDERVKRQQAEIDAAAQNYMTRLGPQGVQHAAGVRKQAIQAQGQEEKANIANEARRKAALQRAAAKKSAEGVQQSVEGLKSQLTKPGTYGLKPKGSSLYVRTYGK